MRFFHVDRVTAFEPGARAAGLKCVALSDEVVHDHFPGYPLLPGVLGVESLAQLGGFLVELSEPEARWESARAMLVQVRDARFHRMIVPGDRLELEVRLVDRVGETARVRGTATVDGEGAVTADLVFALREVPSAELWAQRRGLYRLWTRGLARMWP